MHTPGPWLIEHEDDEGQLFENGVTIESPEGPVAFNVIDCSAPLIAAAPELLSAAKVLVALEENDVDPADTLWKQARKDLRLAIAKAEGADAEVGCGLED